MFSVLGSAFLPAYVCAVFWRKANTPGAVASMIGGAVVAFSWKVTGVAEWTTVHPMLAGAVASTVLMVAVSLATHRRHPVPESILAAMDEAARLGRSS